jgi:hypothetical protein
LHEFFHILQESTRDIRARFSWRNSNFQVNTVASAKMLSWTQQQDEWSLTPFRQPQSLAQAAGGHWISNVDFLILRGTDNGGVMRIPH